MAPNMTNLPLIDMTPVNRTFPTKVVKKSKTKWPWALKGEHRGKFSLSVAKDYRILYTFDRRFREIIVHRVGHRSKVY